VIPYRAVIPDGNAVGAGESLNSFNAMQSPAQLVAFDTEGAADFICRISRIAPDDARQPDQ